MNTLGGDPLLNLLEQYKEGRKDLYRKLDQLDIRTSKGRKDRAIINSMIRDMTYVIKWIETGRNPIVEQGIHKRSVYSTISLDHFPIADDPARRKPTPKLRDLSDYEKTVIRKVFAQLTDRERDCFMYHHCELLTYDEIANKLGIASSTVQSHIERARKKIEKILKGGAPNVKQGSQRKKAIVL